MDAEWIARRVAAAIETLGAPVTLPAGEGGQTWRAVVQPVRDRNRQYLEEQQTPFGGVVRSYALYYGPAQGPGAALQVGSRLCCRGRVYTVRRCEVFAVAEQPVYLWAVLAGEEESDGADH